MDSDKDSAQIGRLEVVETGGVVAGPRMRSSRSCWKACRLRGKYRRRRGNTDSMMDLIVLAPFAKGLGSLVPL
jgi:hypothetical protein